MSCFEMRLPAIAAALAIVTVTLATSETAEAQRRRRARAERADPGAAAPAHDEEARRLFESGEAAYDEGRYESALDDFTRAYALSGRPGLLFNIGSVSERLRRDREALRAYEAYLDAVPDAPNREFTQSRITFLRAQLAQVDETRAEDEPPPESAAAAAPLPPVDDGVDRPERDGRRDAEALRSPLATAASQPATETDTGGGDVTGEWWLWALIGVAVVAAGVGVGVAIATSDDGSAGAPVDGDFGPGGVIVALGSW